MTLAAMSEALGMSGLSPSHILAHKPAVPFALSEGGRHFVSADVAGGNVIAGDFEDPWSRGTHDAERVAAVIAELAG
jgi:hypothetical protein